MGVHFSDPPYANYVPNCVPKKYIHHFIFLNKSVKKLIDFNAFYRETLR